jgi:prepilin-type N-terminal cleavage/methylation domain-containing protein
MKCHRPFPGRSGFTVLEIVAAVAILGIAMLVEAQVVTWALAERSRADQVQAALELAANVLEEARATPWESLTPEWAAERKIPDSLRPRDWRLGVQVEPEKSRPRTKRVTVEVHWAPESGVPTRPARLVGLFTARSSAGGGQS